MSGYDDRDGQIWMDGKLIDWRDANVHILTHAMHYASSVFEGERAYNGKIFKSRQHSERLKASANMIDFDIPWTVDEIEAAKAEVMAASGLTDAYVRAVAWRGAGHRRWQRCLCMGRAEHTRGRAPGSNVRPPPSLSPPSLQV